MQDAILVAEGSALKLSIRNGSVSKCPIANDITD